MFLSKKIYISVFALLSTMSFVAQAGMVDAVLRKADLPKLIGTPEAVNLAAQPLDPKGSSVDVNTFNEFVALGVVSNPSVQTNMTSFNRDQVVLKKISIAGPWIGVAKYTQNEMPNVMLQDGLVAVQACMQKKGTPTPSKEVSSVVIYKTLNTAQFVYDYSFKVPGQSYCQEVLYTPATQGCEFGMQKACHIVIQKSTLKTNEIDQLERT